MILSTLPKTTVIALSVLLAVVPGELARAAGKAVQPVLPISASEPASGLMARQEFEALGLQLVGVASFGGQTTCFVQPKGASTPQTFQVGDEIGRFKIVSIQNEAVEFERSGSRFWLALGGVRAEAASAADPLIEMDAEARTGFAELIQQEIDELESLEGPSEAESAEISVKSVSGKMKTRTSSYETARVIKDAWHVPARPGRLRFEAGGKSSGAGTATASAGSGKFIWPMKGRLTSEFGYRRHPMGGGSRMHSGIDLAAPYGTTIRASAAGKVTRSGYNSMMGRYVYIDHGNGYETRYGHMSARLVKVGQQVKQGEAIGREGSTGMSTGPHLHFEIRKDGRALNPLYYLNK